MLSRLIGTIQSITPAGVELFASPFTFYIVTPRAEGFKLNQQVELYTHLIIKEDGASIFGFTASAQRDLFLYLLKIRSIGPKLAIQIMQSDLKTFTTACRMQDKQSLCSIPGVGLKTAGRILAEVDLETLPAMQSADIHYAQAKKVLMGLGFSDAIIDETLPQCGQESLDSLVKEALQKLGGKNGKSTISS